MRAVLESDSPEALRGAAAAAASRWGEAALAPLLAQIEASGERLRSVAALLDHSYCAASPEASLAHMAAGFDRAAAVSPDVGVAFYALGDPLLLERATAEVLGWLRAEELLKPGLSILEVGCGAGRFLSALADDAARAVGVEISSGMAAEAARRLAAAPRSGVVRSAGGDLAFLASDAFDLVLYIDSFPYVVQAGGELPLQMLRETARVLRPGGAAAFLNWSYRGDPDLDARERAALASQAGLDLRPCSQPVFSGWDAAAAVLRRASS